MFEKCNLSHFKNFDNQTFYDNLLNYALFMPLDYHSNLDEIKGRK